MLAVVMREFGDENVLELDEVPAPSPDVGEARVRVGAVEVSSTRDIATRSGHHAFSAEVSLPHVLGGDFAGIVEDVGAGVDPGLVGQRVAVSNSFGCGECPACQSGAETQCPDTKMLGIHRWGSYAELVTAPAANLFAIPDDLPFAEAAAMVATGPIACTQLRTAEVASGDSVIVTGATGSLATMLIVLGNVLGVRMMALSRRPEQLPTGLEPAATLASDDPELATAILGLSGALGAKAAIDNVADGATFTRYYPALAIGARIVISGAIGTDPPPTLPVPVRPFYIRSQSLLGVRTTNREDMRRFWARVRAGLRLPGGLVHERPLAEVRQAHADVTAGVAVGHTVLSVAS
jgi:D-arabinose 1-dehydrogenase-like Zn-dependent alcohol dehydrogenase